MVFTHRPRWMCASSFCSVAHATGVWWVQKVLPSPPSLPCPSPLPIRKDLIWGLGSSPPLARTCMPLLLIVCWTLITLSCTLPPGTGRPYSALPHRSLHTAPACLPCHPPAFYAPAHLWTTFTLPTHFMHPSTHTETRLLGWSIKSRPPPSPLLSQRERET